MNYTELEKQKYQYNATYWMEHRKENLKVDSHGRLKSISKTNLFGRLAKWHQNRFHHQKVSRQVEQTLRETKFFFDSPFAKDIYPYQKFNGERLQFTIAPREFLKSLSESGKFHQL